MKLNLFLIIIIFGSLSARAQLAGEQDFSLEAAVRQALGHNAELAAARLSVDEARARFLQAGRWSNPELESSFAPNARGREGSFTVGVNQRFPVTSRLRLEKKLSGGQVAVAVAEVAEFERSLTLQVRTAGIRLAALDAQLLLNERRQRNSLDLEAVARAAADAGEGQELEAAQIEMETGHLEIQRVRLKKERAEAATELRLLMGLPEDAVILIGSMEIPSPGTGVTLRPDLRAAQARLEAAQTAARLARASRWEDVSVGLFGEADRSEDFPSGLETDHIIGLRIAAPLPIWGKHKGRVAEAQAAEARARKEAEALARRKQAEESSAREAIAASERLAATIRDVLLPKARKLEERLASLHQEGHSPLGDVLRARERRLELEFAELEAQRDHQWARVRLLAATGATQE